MMPPTSADATIPHQILDVLKASATIMLSGHQNPDADVLGSQLALKSLIDRLYPGKTIHIANQGAPPSYLSFLSGFEAIRNVDRVEGTFDAVVVFECSGEDRMGSILTFKTQAKQVVNIDHHLANPMYGDVNLVDPESASTAELVFRIFEAAGAEPTQQEATALYTGLISDTGWFRYSNTTPTTHRIAARLLECGVRVAETAERHYMSRSGKAMRLLGWVLSSMQLLFSDRVAVMSIPQAVFQDMEATPEDLEEIVNYGLKIDTVRASVLLKERVDQGCVKVSLRSKHRWDIHQVAQMFGGGGHRNAAGCTVQGSLSDADREIRLAMERFFGGD